MIRLRGRRGQDTDPVDIATTANLPDAAFAVAIERAISNTNWIYLALYNDTATTIPNAFLLLRDPVK